MEKRRVHRHKGKPRIIQNEFGLWTCEIDIPIGNLSALKV